MEVRKTQSRTVITLQDGEFKAQETVMQCSQDHSHPVRGSGALSSQVKSRLRHGYDLIVYAGIARYLERKQREEIRSDLLEQRGIKLSTGSISNLCDRFLIYLEALHLSRAPQLRAALKEGYPLHLDATCERGKGGLFVTMAGWRGWVLMSARIPSEHEDYLRPILERTVRLFGYPLATVRDLGKGGDKALEPLRRRGILDLLCHYHFLAAVGTNLFDEAYTLLRRLWRLSKIPTDLRSLLCRLRRDNQVREELPALVLWILEGTARKDLRYPFGLPYLDFYQRCRQVPRRLSQWVTTPRTEREKRAIAQMEGILDRLEQEPRFASCSEVLARRWRSFGQLRDLLQMTNAELPRHETSHRRGANPSQEAQRLMEIEQDLSQYTIQLRQETCREEKECDSPSPESIILGYLDKYGTQLFGHPTLRDENGSILNIVARTNNILEQFYGAHKHALRRRIGRANLARDLEDQPAQAALTVNLRHQDYLHIVCGSLDNLPRAFAELDEAEISRAGVLVRSNRDTELILRIRSLLHDEELVSLPLESNGCLTR